jgi:hypothetical protein
VAACRRMLSFFALSSARNVLTASTESSTSCSQQEELPTSLPRTPFAGLWARLRRAWARAPPLSPVSASCSFTIWPSVIPSSLHAFHFKCLARDGRRRCIASHAGTSGGAPDRAAPLAQVSSGVVAVVRHYQELAIGASASRRRPCRRQALLHRIKRGWDGCHAFRDRNRKPTNPLR